MSSGVFDPLPDFFTILNAEFTLGANLEWQLTLSTSWLLIDLRSHGRGAAVVGFRLSGIPTAVTGVTGLVIALVGVTTGRTPNIVFIFGWFCSKAVGQIIGGAMPPVADSCECPCLSAEWSKYTLSHFFI